MLIRSLHNASGRCCEWIGAKQKACVFEQETKKSESSLWLCTVQPKQSAPIKAVRIRLDEYIQWNIFVYFELFVSGV
jgi:hypothetical protein